MIVINVYESDHKYTSSHKKITYLRSSISALSLCILSIPYNTIPYAFSSVIYIPIYRIKTIPLKENCINPQITTINSA